MAEYVLNDKQRHLLRRLAPGLKQAQIGLEWNVVMGANITAIFESGKINLRSLGWHHANHEDFEQFVDQGFFRVTKHNRIGQPLGYVLSDKLIIAAVENNFLLPDPMAH